MQGPSDFRAAGQQSGDTHSTRTIHNILQQHSLQLRQIGDVQAGQYHGLIAADKVYEGSLLHAI
jgi:hypothetical protein